jgi:hypothetical protein
MRKDARLLKNKAVASLVVSIDHFNRSWDVGRIEAVLIFLDHSFEMLLKAAILVRGGRIRDPRQKNTIGFDAAMRRALSGSSKFLTNDQALVLQTINGLRDAAQHHLLDLSEGQLYVQTQSGVTLFKDILLDVFNENLSTLLPRRVLPVVTIAPLDPIALFADEVEQVKRLLAPGQRRRTEAEARLRGLAIVDGALRGERLQPGPGELRRMGQDVAAGRSLEDIFPGVAAIQFTTEGTGPHVNLRIVKKEGVPIRLVPEGTPDSTVVAVKRVDELGFYNLGHRDLAAKVGLTANKTTAAIAVLDLKEDPDCFKEVRIGRSTFQRYSQQSIERIRGLLATSSPDEIWRRYRRLRRRSARSSE